MSTHRIVFSGSGGQGVITAAIVLAEAAALHSGLNAVQSQAYGPEARGGATRSDVIISEGEILYPKVNHPGILVCLTQESYNKFYSIVRPGGLVLTDRRFVRPFKQSDAMMRSIPMYDNVMEKLGNPIVFNICMLGVINAFKNLVPEQSIIDVLSEKIHPKFIELNLKALKLGKELVEK